MPQQYFLPIKSVPVNGGHRFVGQFIVDGEVTTGDEGGKVEGHPKIKPIEMWELKWIATPGSASAKAAEHMGYEVVAPDDLDYPPGHT